MFMLDIHDSGWRYWLITVFLLSAGLAGWRDCFLGAMVVVTINIIHIIVRDRAIFSFPIEVRCAYIVLLCLSLFLPMDWMYWLLATGTWAQVIFGYCTMARCLSLLPWNRTQALTWRFIWKTFISPPVRGNILQGLPASKYNDCT